jgi:hypothetical protein
VNKIAVRQLPASKQVNTEAEVIFGIWHQKVTDEETANREDLICAVTVVFKQWSSLRVS